MIKQEGKNLSNGKCNLCSGVFSKGEMKKHLKLCLEAKESSGGKRLQKRKTFQILVEGVHNPEYWMYLEAKANATLEDLDKFLRDIWLECCGHMSAFTIGKTSFVSGSNVDLIVNSIWADLSTIEDRERDMDIALGKILAPGLKFFHEYDFGTTTELVLKVITEHEWALGRNPIQLLARNEPPQLLCNECGGIATLVCSQCIYEGKGWLCKKCAIKHECGREMLLPVVNSPRVGMCGYSG